MTADLQLDIWLWNRLDWFFLSGMRMCGLIEVHAHQNERHSLHVLLSVSASKEYIFVSDSLLSCNWCRWLSIMNTNEWKEDIDQGIWRWIGIGKVRLLEKVQICGKIDSRYWNEWWPFNMRLWINTGNDHLGRIYFAMFVRLRRRRAFSLLAI